MHEVWHKGVGKTPFFFAPKKNPSQDAVDLRLGLRLDFRAGRHGLRPSCLGSCGARWQMLGKTGGEGTEMGGIYIIYYNIFNIHIILYK